MQNSTARFALALLTGACLAFVGCESDDGGGQSWTAPSNINGAWVATDLPDVGGPDTSPQSRTLVLTQNGASVSGTASMVYDSGRTATISFSGTYVNGVLTEFGLVPLYYRFSGNATMYSVVSPDSGSGLVRYAKQ